MRDKARHGSGEPPGRFLHDGTSQRAASRRGQPAARPRGRGGAGRRHERHAPGRLGQHQRPGHYDRGARGRLRQEDLAGMIVTSDIHACASTNPLCLAPTFEAEPRLGAEPPAPSQMSVGASLNPYKIQRTCRKKENPSSLPIGR
jgi:hypothetical protein